MARAAGFYGRVQQGSANTHEIRSNPPFVFRSPLFVGSQDVLLRTLLGTQTIVGRNCVGRAKFKQKACALQAFRSLLTGGR